MARGSSLLAPMIGCGVVVLVTLMLFWKICRSLVGRERAPILWILVKLLGGRTWSQVGMRLDEARPEPTGGTPDFGAVAFWVFLLAGWFVLLRAWSQIGR